MWMKFRLDYNTFCLLYKALVRPHLEYAHSNAKEVCHDSTAVTDPIQACFKSTVFVAPC